MVNQYICKNIKIEDVRPGDLVGRDIVSPKGQLVLRKGIELTSTLIDQLKRLGIAQVLIETEGSAVEIDEALLDRKLQKAEMLIDRQFSHVSPDNNIMKGLKEIFREYLQDKARHGTT